MTWRMVVVMRLRFLCLRLLLRLPLWWRRLLLRWEVLLGVLSAPAPWCSSGMLIFQKLS